MHRIIAWFVGNPVAANLMMTIFIVGGFMSLLRLHQEEFPDIELDMVQIMVPYLGATPAEVENAVCIRIEEAIEGVQGIDRMMSVAGEGSCNVMVDLDQESDSTRALNEIKGKVDAISTFPRETEKPIVSMLTMKGGVIQVVLSGDTDELTLKLLAEEMRDDIADMDGISQVGVAFVRPYEISIEVSENTLRQYNLSMDKITTAIRRSSLDMPGGSIKTAGGEILLRSTGQVYRGAEYEDIVILTHADGTNLTLGEIANVRDEFQEGFLKAKFDGERAVLVQVFRVGEEDIIGAAEQVNQYVNEARRRVPDGIRLTIWLDQALELEERVGTLTRNAYTGLTLVLLVLTLFLRFKLAVWVAAGIPIAVLGAIWVFPYAGISISSLTVMAFILVLGIVVDDAIVVGERIHAHEQSGEGQRKGAVEGAYEVCVPVIFGVFTTIAAFLPILLVEGRMGAFFQVIGWVVIVCLAFSLLESQLVLPAHLAHRKISRYMFEDSAFVKAWIGFQGKIASALEYTAHEIYRPLLMRAMLWRYVTWSIGTAVLILAFGLIISGRVVFQFFPAVEGNRIFATLIMPEGVSVELTEHGIAQMEKAAEKLGEQLDREAGLTDGHVIQHMLSIIGSQAARGNGPSRPMPGGSHLAEIVLELAPIDERGGIGSVEISDRWRALAGSIPDAVELTFTANSFSAGEALRIQLMGRDVEELRQAAATLRGELGRYPGVLDLTDSFRAGKQEIRLDILPEAKPLGLTMNDLARQVRQAFYGDEAQRIQRGTDDVRVMVRYPEYERRSIGNLEDMRIRTNDGTEVPFASVAGVSLGNGYSSISREDQKRVVSVVGDVDRSIATPEEVIAAIATGICHSEGDEQGAVRLSFPCRGDVYQGVTYSLSGEQEERGKAMGSIASNAVIALMVIFALLAIPLRSYTQPLVIMSVIPFGAVGAIIGHFIMGWDLVFFSILGIIALSGVVVNASLVLVDYINRQRRKGVDLFDAVTMAGVVRFRPILLTSITTFVGLVPLMASAGQATFFIVPMAISLAFGVLFATAITLFLVPSLYMILEDWLNYWGVNTRDYRLELSHQDDAVTTTTDVQSTV
jgi:multidrug efflux pump subunit AcrB|tara:strand:- start:5243 stop:8506 length:3264 start_codon:yes stop_codon:yes gene_type:complete